MMQFGIQERVKAATLVKQPLRRVHWKRTYLGFLFTEGVRSDFPPFSVFALGSERKVGGRVRMCKGRIVHAEPARCNINGRIPYVDFSVHRLGRSFTDAFF